MGKKSPSWVTPVAIALIVLGLVEDATVAFLLLGILTSLAGVALFLIKRPKH